MQPTKGQQTRQAIVEKAAPLFNKKGFEGTSLSDLMQATGLQKGGIYRHFSGKEENKQSRKHHFFAIIAISTVTHSIFSCS